MNKKQFEIWEKQKRLEYESDLKVLQDNFASRGLAFSGMRNKAEQNLKNKYESEIEITRLGIKDINHGHIAVSMTESGRNNVFINSQINGGLEISGQGNSFITTKITPFKKEHPFWFWLSTVGVILGIITGLMFLAIYFGLIPDSLKSHINPLKSEFVQTATTTHNISDIFSKALSYDIVADRQDFLNKYIGVEIYGEGVVEEISRSGERLLLDVKLPQSSIVCPQEKTDDLERRYPFLQGRSIRFFGTFTYQKYFDHDGLTVASCSFEEI